MIRNKFVCILGFAVLAAVATPAQDKPGTLAPLEFQKPKNGMVKQYEDGRKQKAEWHKQQKDPLPLFVWEVMSGDDTGSYVVGRLNQHWADLDKPAVPDQADLDEFNKVLGPAVQSVVSRYYEYLPKVSSPPADSKMSKFSEIITYHVRYGKDAEFNTLLAKITEGITKTKWPVNFLWFALANGGPTGTYALVIPRNSWAEFEEKPDMKPFRQMLTDAFGEGESDSIIKRLDSCVDGVTSQIDKFRAELSYLPAK
ncbi:MAG TPA: hypothetical protein VN780_10805 [Candidatus Eisenbacteria bacterium]|jgi:hypothetical protein|nr:hypothetical protein [Candidatus Eisenbacteria bacterium]